MKLLQTSVALAAALALASQRAQAAPTATCVSACPENLKPLCGSDGVTYDNECMFEYARCSAANAGKTPALTVASNSACAGSSGGGSACAQEFACLSNYDPVCGSDGKTYSNACTLKLAQCKSPTLTQKSAGECSGSAAGSGSAGNGSSGTVCTPKGCTKEFKPVCSSDGVTYSNKCAFTNAQCEAPKLTLKAEMSCDDVSASSVSSDADSSGSSACATVCTMEFEPLCGSNGITYNNECLFKNAQCSNATITKKADGACAATPTPAPAPTTSGAAAVTTVGVQVTALAVLSVVASVLF